MRFMEGMVEMVVKCPMYFTDPLSTDPYPEVKGLLNWAILEAFRDRLATAAQLRAKFEHMWTGWSKDHGIRDAQFYTGIRAGNTAARKIYLLLQEFRVIKPFGYYEVPIDGHTVHGSYAVLSNRSERSVAYGIPYVLVEREFRPAYHQQPGVIEMLRHHHFVTSTIHPTVRILNFPVLRGDPWERKNVDVSLVHRYLSSILRTTAASEFPAPGSQCETCASKSCRKVFYE